MTTASGNQIVFNPIPDSPPLLGELERMERIIWSALAIPEELLIEMTKPEPPVLRIYRQYQRRVEAEHPRP